MRGSFKPLILLAVCLLSAAYYIVWRSPAAGTFHDDAVYMVTAKALAEGKGYRLISLPQEVAQTKYPPLFPLLLSLIWKVFPAFPGNVPYLKMVPLISALLWFALAYRLLREEGAPKEVAAAITLLTASCGWVLYLSTAVLSETLFAMLTTAALLFLRRAEKSDANALRASAIASVFAVLAFYTRSVGLALFVAATLLLLYRKKWQPALVFASLSVFLSLPWLFWVSAHRAAAATADGYQSIAPYQSWNVLFGFTLAQKLHIFGMNILAALAAPAALAGVPTIPLLMLPAMMLGAWIIWGIRKVGVQALTVFIVAYAGLTLLWAWPPLRLFAPLVPLFYWLAYKGLEPRPRLLAGITVAICIFSLIGVLKPVRQAIRLGDAQPALSTQDTWDHLQLLMEWVKQNTPADAVLAGNLDPFYYLATGRKATRGFFAEPFSLVYSESENPIGTANEIVSRLQAQGVSYWILSPNSAFKEGTHLLKIQNIAIENHAGVMKRLHASPLHSHDVVELRNTKLPRVHIGLR